MYPEGTTKIYSNLTPRKSRVSGINGIVVFGIQYFILEYLIEQWNRDFFLTHLYGIGDHISAEDKEAVRVGRRNTVISKYKRTMDNTLGKDAVDMSHIEKLWDLGYMPLEIKALPEGSVCPIGVPCMTITNTVDHAYWLVNYLETILSCTVWQPMTSATIANHYRKLLNGYALKTVGSTEFVPWQGHDFSMRGMSSLETACTSGAAHLLSFTGTDTVPAIDWLEQYYGADVEKELVGASVPATEHSVMCMGLKDGELATFDRLLNLYPTGILSVVSDTWNLWDVIKRGGICEQLKEKILSRDGKLVIRPDSGDPVKIITGYMADEVYLKNDKYYELKGYTEVHNNPILGKVLSEEERKGVVECLWDIFGGTISERGYKVLDSHIGAIYGDSINIERATQICERLITKGFASTNIVFGIGSYTYQMNTRDTFGFAMKATYGEVLERKKGGFSRIVKENGIPVDYQYEVHAVGREIFKDPITDSGEKKSARGLLRVDHNDTGNIVLYQQQTKEEEKQGLLETVFLDGKLIKKYTLAEVRENLRKND